MVCQDELEGVRADSELAQRGYLNLALASIHAK